MPILAIMKKRKVGRPEVADKKMPFPLRLRPSLVRLLKKAAKYWGIPVGTLAERIIKTVVDMALAKNNNDKKPPAKPDPLE